MCPNWNYCQDVMKERIFLLVTCEQAYLKDWGFLMIPLEKKNPDTVKVCTGTQKDSHEPLSPDISLFL